MNLPGCLGSKAEGGSPPPLVLTRLLLTGSGSLLFRGGLGIGSALPDLTCGRMAVAVVTELGNSGDSLG